MSDPLHGLDPREREFLMRFAETEGLTLEQARQQRDANAKALRKALRKAARDVMKEMGITAADLRKEMEHEEWLVEHLRQSGVTVSGKWGATLAANTGARTLNGAKRGHATTHGTESEKEHRRQEYQAYLDALRVRNPALSLTEARRKTAAHFGVNAITIRRNTT